MFKYNKFAIIVVTVALIVIGWFFIKKSSGISEPSPSTVKSIHQLSGKVVGILQGSNYEDNVNRKVSGVKLMHFNSESDELQALRTGKVDAIVTDLPIANELMLTGAKLRILPEVFDEESCGFLIAERNKANLSAINKIIKRMKADGTLKRLENKWLSGDQSQRKLEDVKLEAKNGTWRIGMDAQTPPMNYIKDGQMIGLEVDILRLCAAELGYDIKILNFEYSALINALVTNKVDIVASMMVETKARANSVLFSESYYQNKTIAVVLDDISSKTQNSIAIEDMPLSAFKDKRLAGLTGSVWDDIYKRNIGEVQVLQFDDHPSRFKALENGKVDAVGIDEPIARLITAQKPHLTIIKTVMEADAYGLAFRKGSPLKKPVEEIVLRFKQDGTLNKIKEKWLSADVSKKVMPILDYKKDYDGSSGKITYMVDAMAEPMAYFDKNNKVVGIEPELMERVAYELNMKLETTPLEFKSLIAALASGKADVASGCMSITEERKQAVDFVHFYDGGAVLLVLNNRAADKQGSLTLDDMKGKTIADITGSVYAEALKGKLDVSLIEYNTNADRLQALLEEKVDGIIDEEPSVRYMMAYNDGKFSQVSGRITSDNYAGAVRLDNKELGDNIDRIIRRLRADGTLDKLDEKWFKNVKEDKSIDIKLEPKNGIIRIATMAQIPPFTYVNNNRIVGYDIEMMHLVAQELGMGIEIMDMPIAGVIPAIVSKKADVTIGCITVTPERAKSIRFLEPSYQGGLVIMVKNKNLVKNTSFIEELKDSWQNNFIKEDRYKLVLKGLWTTIIITVGSAIIGTVLAFVVCLMRRSSNKLLSIAALIYIRLVQGTPMVVLLLILYYVVFARLEINENLVAIIAFAINFSAYVAEMMRTGIAAVDKGQVEAGQALGFGNIAIYKKIIYPQALRHILPVYKGEFISMLKMTSVVGYIAIQDLTKMSDIIRSRTYDAFFPLIVTAFIYFVVAYVFIYLLNRVEAGVDPKRRNRSLNI